MLVAFRQSGSLLRRLYPFDQSLKFHGKQILTLAILLALLVSVELLACYSKRFVVLKEAELGVLEPLENTCSLEYH
jgi:hypothetical protein